MSPEPIPVAIVLSSLEPGGTEHQMIELMRRLDRERFRVHGVCFRRSGTWLARMESAVDDVADFPLQSFKSFSAVRMAARLTSWLRDRKIAVIQTCDLWANISALPCAAAARVPVRIGSRRELAPPDKTRALLFAQRLAYRAANRVVANSRAAVDRLAGEGVPRARIALIRNGIELADFPSRRPSLRPRVISTVANLREEKGHDVLLRAAAIVLREVPDARFRIVGDGPLMEPLRSLASDLGIGASIEFLGHRNDVPQLLATSDVFVFPSRSEASPNGLIEAMASGLPSIASATGGILELVEDGRNGILVPVGDDRALARAIVTVIGDPAGAARFGRAARDTIETRHSFDRMVAAFEQLYTSALAETAKDMSTSRYARSGEAA